jgi:hypothetical protein
MAFIARAKFRHLVTRKRGKYFVKGFFNRKNPPIHHISRKTEIEIAICRLSVLACRQSGDHSENNLAKFGYILDMKVGKKKERILLYSWLPTGTYHKNLATGGEKKSLHNLANLHIFFQ